MARMKKAGGGMIRLMTILLWAVFAAGPAAAAESWTGQWQITWGNGGALLNLHQDGNAVGGSFGQGTLQGTVHDGKLDGEIVYNGQTERLTATLSDDFDSFAGATESGDWLNGQRMLPGDPSSAVTVDLSTPRAALRSFLRAANLAQADKSYALSAALDVISFGNDPGWLSREARFAGAQQMFQLIDRATFNMATIPDQTTDSRLTLALPLLDDKSAVSIDMQRNGQGNWQIVMPAPDRLRAELDSARIRPADSFRLLQSPRDTLRTFLNGMQHWNSGGEAAAIGTIDLSRVPEVLRNTEGALVAQYLVRIIDRVGQHTLQSVPNSGADREPFVYFELPAGRIVIEPVGTGDDTRWKFSAQTAFDIRELYRSAEQLPDGHALDPSFIPPSSMFALRGEVKRYAPVLLKSLPGPGRIERWQLVASILALLAIVILTLVLRAALLWVMGRDVLKRHVVNPRRLALGLAMGISFIIGSRFISTIGLPAVTRQYTVPVLGTALIIIIGYALWQLVVFVLSVLQEIAEKTDTAVDNILITFAAGVAKLSIVVGGVLLLSYLWSLPTSGLLAGLGISGLAVAFASKETISNVFGAGILLGDRPFGKGDRIIAGDVNGWVESVGLRSTRVRTLHDSVLVVPNGKLADMVVNNLGARRRRSLSTTVIVTSGATPDRLEAFTNDIRQRIAGDPLFESQGAEVNISRVWHEGIDVEISAMVETRSGRTSREATHKLYLDIMRMAEAHGLTLAHATAPAAPAA
jgi:MscS family membrane protein